MTALREMTNLIYTNGIVSSVINKFPTTRSQFNFFYFLQNTIFLPNNYSSSLSFLVVTSLTSKHSNTKLADNAKSRRTASYMYRLTIYTIRLVVAFARCQRKKKNLPTSPVLVPMFIKPFQLLRREFPLQALLIATFLPCSWP